VEANTDSPLNLEVGEEVTVFGEADDEDFDAITITRSNGEVLNFSDDSESEFDDDDDFEEEDDTETEEDTFENSLLEELDEEFTEGEPSPEDETENDFPEVLPDEEELVEITDASSKEMPIFGSIEDNIFETVNANDLFQGNQSILFAGAGNDLVDASGSEGGKRLYGGSGNDILIAGRGNRVFGESGDDSLYVTDGGGNLLTGGLGTDTFYLANAEIPENINVVSDFKPGEDQIAIAGFDELNWEDITLQPVGNNTILSIFDRDVARLNQVQPQDLSSEDFQFIPSSDLIL
jgi:hypothetical protein